MLLDKVQITDIPDGEGRYMHGQTGFSTAGDGVLPRQAVGEKSDVSDDGGAAEEVEVDMPDFGFRFGDLSEALPHLFLHEARGDDIRTHEHADDQHGQGTDDPE